MKCISCNVTVGMGEYKEFYCPNCGKKIIRCKKCCILGIPYKCECGFEGP
jgi:predicted RNA-binding Zn-ribbon protein involved in translation (DUF1610 family)